MRTPTRTTSTPLGRLEAKKKIDDEPFIVLCDGEEVEYSENPELHERELIIPFVKGTKEIMIVGTSIIGSREVAALRQRRTASQRKGL